MFQSLCVVGDRLVTTHHHAPSVCGCAPSCLHTVTDNRKRGGQQVSEPRRRRFDHVEWRWAKLAVVQVVSLRQNTHRESNVPSRSVETGALWTEVNVRSTNRRRSLTRPQRPDGDADLSSRRARQTETRLGCDTVVFFRATPVNRRGLGSSLNGRDPQPEHLPTVSDHSRYPVPLHSV